MPEGSNILPRLCPLRGSTLPTSGSVMLYQKHCPLELRQRGSASLQARPMLTMPAAQYCNLLTL